LSAANDQAPQIPPPPPSSNNHPGHGRNKASDYTGLTTIKIKHATLQNGSFCPECLKHRDPGRVYLIDPGVLITLQGNPPITGNKYLQEKLRCNFCGHLYCAELPADIVDKPKYAASCYATIAINKYYMGLPFHRLQAIQKYAGIPLPKSTQWDLVHELYQEAVQFVYKELIIQGAEGNLMHYDDTPQRILIHQKLQATTVVISKVNDKIIYLFFSGTYHAGGQLNKLLSNRESDEEFITMSDAADKNFSGDIPLTLLVRMIICLCLCHGRRSFHELLRHCTKECTFVIEQIGSAPG